MKFLIVARFANGAARTDSTYHIDVSERFKITFLRPFWFRHETPREALPQQTEIV